MIVTIFLAIVWCCALAPESEENGSQPLSIIISYLMTHCPEIKEPNPGNFSHFLP